MQKLFKYYGNFDDNGNWNDNMDEFDNELKDGWTIVHTLLEKSLKFSNTNETNDYEFKSSDKIILIMILEKDTPIADEPLCLQIGPGLISLVDKKNGGKLLEGIKEARKNLFFPKVRIVDNSSFEKYEYKLFSYDSIVSKGIIDDTDTVEKQVSVIVEIIKKYTWIRIKNEYNRLLKN